MSYEQWMLAAHMARKALEYRLAAQAMRDLRKADVE